MTPKELVLRTLEFRNFDDRAPRQLWLLPWAVTHYPQELQAITDDFPPDITGVEVHYHKLPQTKGNPYEPGEYIDDWGCRFFNLMPGVVGEVKEPLIPANDDSWSSADAVHIPEEWLSFDIEQVNQACAKSDCFLTSGACPRPFEQLQFIRGTEQLYIDLMDPPAGMLSFLDKMHAFYCRQLEKWACTDVDALTFMDDWGAQNNLLIHPDIWRSIFKPMYRDYIDIAHRHGKKAFMHSDGHILRILPDLVELGLDAVNAQLFCMGLDNLTQFRGQICFWGEIDRQHLLPYGTPQDIRNAVMDVKNALWQNGGCIAQCEFGVGAKPENVRAVFETWDAITRSKTN